MSMLASGLRPKRRADRPSVREVCLMGMAHEAPGRWGPGDRVTLAGRVYRVEETPARADGAPRYVHLTAEVEG